MYLIRDHSLQWPPAIGTHCCPLCMDSCLSGRCHQTDHHSRRLDSCGRTSRASFLSWSCCRTFVKAHCNYSHCNLDLPSVNIWMLKSLLICNFHKSTNLKTLSLKIWLPSVWLRFLKGPLNNCPYNMWVILPFETSNYTNDHESDDHQ